MHDRRATGKAYVAVNCAALPETLIESELFGYERGAFTGAAQQKKGKFELASGGTMFLDEIGDMNPVTQAKVLRALESRTIERLGGTQSIAVDVRVISATHRNLAAEIRERKIPRGFVLSAARGHHRVAAFARTQRRYSGARRGVSANARLAAGANGANESRSPGGNRTLRLAGQRARAEKRAGAQFGSLSRETRSACHDLPQEVATGRRSQVRPRRTE